jgi:2-(1,2-epoxy-1,2-dihydrophenyl)acetyl-CoA isomerase
MVGKNHVQEEHAMATPPDDDPILLDIAEGLATITLNRPHAYNALDLALCDGLVRAAIECDENPAVRAVLVTGSGTAFCAGGDIRQMQEHVVRDGDAGRFLKQLAGQLHLALATFAHMAKPVITAVNGPAAGAGFSLALAGDLALASEAAKFTVAYTAIAVPPDGSLSFHLPRLIGPKLAYELACSNRSLTAAEACDLRLINAVYPAASFAVEAKGYAANLARGPTVALGQAKRLIALAAASSHETQMEYERQAIALCGHSADFKEGIAAFLAKRKAVFRGS